MKTYRTTGDDPLPQSEEVPPRSSRRRLLPPLDEEPANPNPSDPKNIKARLDHLNRCRRFSAPPDLRLFAVAWANEYVRRVFSDAPDAQRISLLLAAEAGFFAAAEIRDTGIQAWERLLEKGKTAREDFLPK